VVLQVPGAKQIQVIKQVRITTGLGLTEAKKVIDDAPAVVVEGLSQESAELVADRLRAAGATALAAPIGEM
jgi:large subunit ribosomal protein L7/L12